MNDAETGSSSITVLVVVLVLVVVFVLCWRLISSCGSGQISPIGSGPPSPQMEGTPSYTKPQAEISIYLGLPPPLTGTKGETFGGGGEWIRIQPFSSMRIRFQVLKGQVTIFQVGVH